ncbi:MAG: hypothetical protein Q4C95_00940 [Planctomycetia bacterium]|nr:hypothetical protein [Planctomycetia bacterium]
MDYTIKSWKTSVYFLKVQLFRRRSWKQFHEYLSHENMSADELERYSFLRKVDILRYAYEKSPFYKERFDSLGFNPLDVKEEKDWQDVPVLTKDDLRHCFDKIVVTGISKNLCSLSTTGGSTGTPTAVYHDRRFFSEAISWRLLRWWGIGPGENRAKIWRTSRDISSRISKLIHSLTLFPSLTILLDSSFVTEQDMLDFAKTLQEKKVVFLQGYTGAVHQFALFCDQNNIHIDSLKAIKTSSSPLLKPIRTEIEKVFGVPVYDQYGCSEITWLAAQCHRRQHMHIFNDIRCIEFLDDNNRCVEDETYGKIAVTDLENHVFPLIRYQNGDMGRKMRGACPCGLPFPLMDTVKGRVTDNLRFADGSYIAGDYLTTLFDNNPECVTGFQVRQNKDYSVTLLVVPNVNYPLADKEIEKVANLLKEKIKGTEFRLVQTDEIKHDRGKLRYVVSEI